MKYQEDHLEFVLEYEGQLIKISEDTSFDFDSSVGTPSSQEGLPLKDRSQTIIQFTKPEAKILALLDTLHIHKDFLYTVRIGLLEGRMYFESIEIRKYVRIHGEFQVSQTTIF